MVFKVTKKADAKPPVDLAKLEAFAAGAETHSLEPEKELKRVALTLKLKPEDFARLEKAVAVSTYKSKQHLIEEIVLREINSILKT